MTSPENRSNPQFGNACHPLAATAHPPAIAFKECQSGTRYMGDVHPTIDANKGTRRQKGVQYGMQVRRLTPRECERLQGQRDDYTLITFNRKPVKDGPRYKALGNSMAVPVMRWIGERIQLAVECF